jgi:hypothetical protein
MNRSNSQLDDVLPLLTTNLHIMIGPVIIGAGTPVFAGQLAVSLQLIDTPRTWDGSQNVLVRYEARRQKT